MMQVPKKSTVAADPQKVITAKPKIVISKFWKGIILTILSSILTYLLSLVAQIQDGATLTIGAALSGLIITVFKAISKGLEEYDPNKDQ